MRLLVWNIFHADRRILYLTLYLMAENIRKVYPPAKNSSAGSWYHDTDKERYERVMHILERWLVTKEYDENDVKWFVKCAILNKIYISEGVYAMGEQAWKRSNTSRRKEILQIIENEGYATHKEIDLEKCRKGIRFEHMVPFNVVLPVLKEMFEQQQLTPELFQKIRSKLNICFVTPDEDRVLNKAFRQEMPDKTDWLNHPNDEFARYDKVGVKIYKRVHS